ncbi:MAG TPA: 1-(5-phosphoribosyl)-5-amino-4-imidazole-carboxylate carboxylase, partial [Bacillales bacterium]|nr:1-(5-phosphoribosyl)-5-amino-4-imidazole-carboxylate carboxylase [Bacillales bacterium]
MNKDDQIEALLKKVKDGTISIAEAKDQIKPYEDLGFAKLDHLREERTGFPEVVFGEGKTADQVMAIFERLMNKIPKVLATR